MQIPGTEKFCFLKHSQTFLYFAFFPLFFFLLLLQSQKPCHPDLSSWCRRVPSLWCDPMCPTVVDTHPHPADCPPISVFYLASWLPTASLCGLILQDLLITHAVQFLPQSHLFLRCKKIHFPSLHFPPKAKLPRSSVSEWWDGRFPGAARRGRDSEGVAFCIKFKACKSETERRCAGLHLSDCRVASSRFAMKTNGREKKHKQKSWACVCLLSCTPAATPSPH